jgi:adenosylcobinamide-phosphate synthase
VKLAQQILLAALLDSILGDPSYRAHPVRLMGRLAAASEGRCRRLVADEKLAGVLAAALVVLASVAGASGLMAALRRVHPRLEEAMSIFLLYSSIAPRDLAAHAQAVEQALARDDLPAARQAVGRMVGRDTAGLDTREIVRAAVESVAENTVDGVTSPLFWAFVGGTCGAVAFKAVSTLDSLFGYKNERYLRFGWASARLDDAANYLPARLSVPFIAAAAACLGHSPGGAVRTVLRDARKHASPNSGFAEAAIAGALGVRLGGPVSRGGVPVACPCFGEPRNPLTIDHIRAAVRLMWVSSVLFGAVLAAVRRRWK